MKRRIALLLVICLLTSMVPAATAGGTADDGVLGSEIEIVDVDGQDMSMALETDGIELEADGLPNELGDILPECDTPELELEDSLNLPENEPLLSESEAQSDALEANDDSADFTIVDGVMTAYNGAGGDVVIPDGVTSIDSYVFIFRSDITSVTIPSSVKKIGDFAFMHCTEMARATVAEGVVEIGEQAFWNCLKLDINIPQSVSVIGEGAFAGCKRVNLSEGNGYYTWKDGILYTGDMKTLMFCSRDLDKIVVPKGTISIGCGAFWNRDTITHFSISDSVTDIGGYAFTGCTGLTEIAIPGSVTSMGEYAFSGCNGLSHITIPGKVATVGMYAFAGCEGLTDVELSNGVTRIGERCFSNCKKLASVLIPASVVEISSDAFKDSGSVKIKGYTGSYAQSYAKDMNIPFVPIDAPEISILKTLTLGVKETYALDAAGASFKSSNAAVASVDKKGVVTAKKAGSATVTVTVDKKTVGSCKVTVVKAPTKVSFAEKSVTLGVKETLALKPTITKGSHTAFTWSVKDKKVASVDKDGVVTGKKAGKTTVTVKTHNGLKATLTVTVQKAPTSVSLPKKAVTLGVKEALTLTPTITKGAHTSFTWSVADSKIATVTNNGKITGKKAGKTTITVKTHNGKKASVKVTVMAAPTSVSLEAKVMALGVKEAVKLTPTIDRDAHTSYTWTVKNNKIATVTADGKLTGKKAGKTTVTVKTHNGKKATLTVNVMAAPGSITLSGKSRNLTVGDAIMLMPTLPKKTASRIKWTSSNKSVATVDASGVVRALKKGKAKITAKTFNGKKAVCTVTVGEGASYLAFDAEALSVGVKEKVTLKPQVNEGAKVKYTWTTGDKKVATVSGKGVVTGVKAGNTDITVKTQNGLTATVKVTVLAAPKKVTLNKGKATLPENQTLQLKATLPKKTASQIKWSSSDKKVAAVDENGLVTAVAKGKATITAQTFNGKKATCVVTVREETPKDQSQSFWDAYQEALQEDTDYSDQVLNLLSLDDFGGSEEMAEYIETYNGIVNEINTETEMYIEKQQKMEDELDQLMESIGVIKIVAKKESIRIVNQYFTIELPTNFNQSNALHGLNGNATIISNINGVDGQSVEPGNVGRYVEDAANFVVNSVGGFLNLFEVMYSFTDALTDHKQYMYGELKGAIEKELRKGGLDPDTKAKLNKQLEETRKLHKKWKDNRIKLNNNKVWKWFEDFKEKQISAGLALGTDAFYAGKVTGLLIHRHPANDREREDSVRDQYVTKLKENMGEATKWIVTDVGYNVGVIALEFYMFGRGGAAKQLSKTAAEKLGKKYLEVAGEKWMKFAFTGVSIGVGAYVGNKVSDYSEKMVRCDDILHGKIRGTISGKVIDADTKKPIAGALVATDEKRSTTKADGSFVLSAMYGDYSGKYAVKCTKEGYVDGTGEVTVDEDASDAEVTIEMVTEGLPIDEPHFPDANFRYKVREFDLNSNDSLSDEEIEKITAVAVDDLSIESLEGIQYFTSMQKLSCARNALKKLDIMECGALRELDCSENLFLTSLTVAGHKALETLNCSDNPLTTLDVSQCPKLKTVNCTTTYEGKSNGKLMSLNASGSTALKSLDCSHNQLTLLDVGGCTALQTLDCSYNKLTSVTTGGVSSSGALSLNGCTALQELRCNNNQLTGLSVKGCAGLQKLFCNSNKLTGLDVGGMTKLTDLNCGDNQLTSLNVSGCAVLQVLNCSVNKLKALDISACPSLQELYCTSNQIEVLNYLDIRRLKVAQYDDGTRVAVPFGHYDQDANPSNGKEPIEWLVLEDKGDTLTLISRYGLDAKPYHTEWVDITWANCTLRSWLNGTFLNAAFTSAEQGKIQTVRVTAEDNPYWGTEAGSDTYDKVWLLSIREAENLFSSDAARICYPTATAKANGCWTYANGACWWWLRSPGDLSSIAARVGHDGGVHYYINASVGYISGSVRPVVCLRLS